MAKLSLLRRALEQHAEQAEQAAAAGGTVRERFRALGRADAYRHALTLLTNAEGPIQAEEPSWPTCQDASGCDSPVVYGRTLCRLHAHYLDVQRRYVGA